MLRQYFREIISLDQQIFLWVNQKILYPATAPLFILITELGSAIGVLLIGTTLLLFCRKYDWKDALKKFYLTLATAGILAILFKKFFHRLRPVTYFHNLQLPVRWLGLGLDGPSSFPSGHSLATGVLVFVLSYYFPSRKLLFWLLGLLIMFSRVYVGAHFPLDVLTGFFIGFLIAFVFFNFIFPRPENVSSARQSISHQRDE